MRIRPTSHRCQAGSILLVSLITCAILGGILASYLMLVQTQSISVMRSQAWNASLALTEAGIEEALSQLNRNAPFFDPAEATNNLSANSWTRVGNTYYAPRRYLGRSFYDVSITMNGLTPFINATSYVWMADSYSSAPQPTFASVSLWGGDGHQYQSRKVLVHTQFDPLFAVAMAAISTIDFNGNNVMTDSFDSGDPNHSNNGLYPVGQPAKTKRNGDVCTDLSIVDSIDIGNANIYGKAKTGPNGTVHVGKNGFVTGGISDDFNVIFPPVTVPQTSWIQVPTGNWTINGVSYKHAIFTSGDYYMNGCSGSIYIHTNTQVRIKVTADVKLTSNSDVIRIAPDASLRLFMTASTFKLSGHGLVNETGLAQNFSYYGTTNNTSVEFSGNSGFVGTIYAPQAAFSLGGGGNNSYDFVGASITGTVKMNGHFNFHYDEALRKFGPSRGFIPTLWKEM